MKRSDFIKALAGIPLVGLAFDALKAEGPVGADELPEEWVPVWGPWDETQWQVTDEPTSPIGHITFDALEHEGHYDLVISNESPREYRLLDADGRVVRQGFLEDADGQP